MLPYRFAVVLESYLLSIFLQQTYVNLDVYNDKDYVNFDMVDELQWFPDEADSERGKVFLMNP